MVLRRRDGGTRHITRLYSYYHTVQYSSGDGGGPIDVNQDVNEPGVLIMFMFSRQVTLCYVSSSGFLLLPPPSQIARASDVLEII